MPKLTTFWKSLFISVTVTRLVTFALKVTLNTSSPFTERIVGDQLHHYQLGLVLIVFSLFYSKQRSKLVPIGLGIFLEELPVVLGNLGLNTTRFYHSVFEIDFVVILGMLVVCWAITRRLSERG